MKNKKQETVADKKTASANPRYGAQDFEQGRGGLQAGHNTAESETFTQFQNTGNAGYAAQPTANSIAGTAGKIKK